jgi:hypothetical protein
MGAVSGRTSYVSHGRHTLPRYGHAVAHQVERVGTVIAGIAAFVLAGCGGGASNGPAESAEPDAVQSNASATKDAPVKSTESTPVDQEIAEIAGFVSPTGNVSCMIDTQWARCDIIDRDWAPPPRPADCEFDYGQGISLAPGEQPQFVCAGDTAFGADEVLAYGESVTAGPIRCESAESGITCRDEESGHGFSISREAYRLF